jgi:hypothetical protein
MKYIHDCLTSFYSCADTYSIYVFSLYYNNKVKCLRLSREIIVSHSSEFFMICFRIFTIYFSYLYQTIQLLFFIKATILCQIHFYPLRYVNKFSTILHISILQITNSSKNLTADIIGLHQYVF